MLVIPYPRNGSSFLKIDLTPHICLPEEENKIWSVAVPILYIKKLVFSNNFINFLLILESWQRGIQITLPKSPKKIGNTMSPQNSYL